MIEKRIYEMLQGFIDEINICRTVEEARDIRDRIERFYETNSVPESEDILAQSGFCEMLAMMAA